MTLIIYSQWPNMIKKSFTGENFTKVPNELLRTKTLSLEAKGLLTYLLSYPESWKIYKNFIIKDLNITEYKLRKLMKELKDAKLIKDIIKRDTKGVILNKIIILDISDRSIYDRL